VRQGSRLKEIIGRLGSRGVADERGQGLVEYALIIAIVSLGAIIALGFLSGKINGLFSKAGSSLNTITVAEGGSGSSGGGGSAPTPGTPSISCPGGSCQFTELATASPGTWGGSPSFTYQWAWNEQVNGTPCDAATTGWTNLGTGTTQTIPNVNSGGGDIDFLRVIVTGTNGSGSATALTCVSYGS
jgi:Flp pilus assembly pilin Flp